MFTKPLTDDRLNFKCIPIPIMNPFWSPRIILNVNGSYYYLIDKRKLFFSILFYIISYSILLSIKAMNNLWDGMIWLHRVNSIYFYYILHFIYIFCLETPCMLSTINKITQKDKFWWCAVFQEDYPGEFQLHIFIPNGGWCHTPVPVLKIFFN